MYTQAFFIKKCYLNYEKEIISCAALYLASKNEYYKRKLSDFIFNYHKAKLSGKVQFLCQLNIQVSYSNLLMMLRRMSLPRKFA